MIHVLSIQWICLLFEQQLLTDMKEHGVNPNLGTLNAILETLSTMGNIKQAKHLCLQTLSEFRRLGIEPSLASYYYLLTTFCKDSMEILNFVYLFL